MSKNDKMEEITDTLVRKDPQPPEEKKVYDPADLVKMAKAGLPKPKDCTWAQWVGPKKRLNPRHKLIAYMTAQGAKVKDIAKEVGMSEYRVTVVRNSTRAKEYIDYLQYSLYGKPAEVRFKEILPEAINRAEEIMSNPNEKSSLVADVAFKFMDRALGKPKTQIEHSGNLIRDLFDQIDEIKKVKKEISVESVNIDDAEFVDVPKKLVGIKDIEDTKAPPDDIDDFVDEFFPEES